MSRIFPVWSALLAAFIVATSIYGGYHFFSPIPYVDQWDGYIGFYKILKEGIYQVFWVQHMEHRLVLARALFWLDIAVFGGWNAFTVILNYLMLAGIGLVIFGEYRRGRAIESSPWLIGGIVFGFLFLWCQNENLKWGFQVPTILVYLFSTLAFAFFSRPDHRASNIAIALVFGVLSMLSLGNGILVFFIMAIQGFLQRRPWKESLIAIVAGCIAAAIYFHGYIIYSLPLNPDVAHLPLARIKFFLMFLGNPVFFVTGDLRHTAALGILSLAVAAAMVIYLFRKREITPYRAFLIANYGMVVAAAMGAARSRWMLGLVASAAGRYTTPVLLGYAVLALLALDMAVSRRVRFAACAVPLLLITWLASYQTQAWGDNSYLFKWKLAVLGQKIGLDHPAYDALIFPATAHDRYVDGADFSASRNIGPYGRGWLHDAGIVKYDPAKRDDSLCHGFIEPARTDSVGITVGGWMIARDADAGSALIVLTDNAGQTVGYGITGAARPDVSRAVPGAPDNAGWTGFARADAGALSAYAYVDNKFCKLSSIR